jgi:hypothetical protein
MSIFTTQIVISAIAVISCMVLIIALMIPLSILLLRDLRKRYTDRTASAGTIPGTTIRSTGRRTRSQPTTTVEPAYSSYNLYLVYIAIPDLMLNLYFLSTYAAVISNRYIYHEDFENAFIISCSTANLVRIFLLFISRNALQYNFFKVLFSNFVFSFKVFELCSIIRNIDTATKLSSRYTN